MIRQTKKPRKAGRPPMGDEPMKRVNVMLSEKDLERASALGGGNVSLGLRLALERAEQAAKKPTSKRGQQ
jgi:hypothetical protein